MNATRILVPLDGSGLAETALAAAADMARPGAGTLILIRAAQSRVRPGVDPINAQIEVVQEAELYLAAVKDKLDKQGGRDVQTGVWYGPAASAIIDAAKLYRADLIVMSTHGRSGVGRLIFGSVAESVLRGTTVPIFLLRPAGAPVERPAEGAPARPVSGPEPRSKTEALR
jgi:nucleotide-binding universal stress UspA family protein